MTIENLPDIEGGTDKQKAFADSVRQHYLRVLATAFEPQFFSDGLLVVKVHTDHKWWISKFQKIDQKAVKAMIRTTKAAITRAGSIEAALEAQRDTLEKQAARAEKARLYHANSRMMFMDDTLRKD